MTRRYMKVCAATACMAAALAGLAPSPVRALEPMPAQEPDRGQAQAAGGASDGQPVCVDAEVGGERALSYSCLSQRLSGGGNRAAAAASNPAEGIVTSPSNRVGTFNYSSESIRFGSNWGKSAVPQRPQPTPATRP
ncbi:hypothetical protein SAMN06295900_12198 [Trinickia caryophylli]|uniref:Tat (Twin-arginine translocation) pathway signal sequence n=1 Tax=Trinickia caryophylli TaxID=28094 RepID=A0A1X7H4M2_TRICW|nr:hypothetical protein SAMN06295900_12198 [Trinickia caryophylli]